jgi:hypothetical protein
MGPPPTVTDRALPMRPILGGLLVNALLYATALWVLAWVTRPLLRLRPVRWTREALRARQGLCPECAFDLKFDLARGCPECGWHRALAESR